MSIPSKISLHTESRELELGWGDDLYRLSYEFLRVHSPSAEVKGHGSPVLQIGKKDVTIRKVEPVGNYALKISFNDGHDTGLYNWDYLKELSVHRDKYWQTYLEALEQSGSSREPLGIQIKSID